MTRPLPSGALTFLFTFIEGVARHWEEHPHAFGAAVLRHQAIIRECLARHDGREVKSPGDSFFVVFQSPREALRCACAIHAALAGRSEVEEVLRCVGGVRVRIGAHLGEAVVRSGDYFGPAVNRAARIADAGHGGMTIISGTLREAASTADADDGISFEDCGLHRLKDLGSPVHLYQVLHPSCPPVEQRMLRTLEGIQHNIPPQQARFVGRAVEMEALTELLRGGQRMVTLTGTAGTGKTRLALQAAVNRLQDYPDGVWFVDLAGVSDPGTLPTALALALKISLTANLDPMQQVLQHLKERVSLLVLDNFEQVIDAAALVQRLVETCPRLRCMVTSRELLRIAGEREFVVEPLPVPPSSAGALDLETYESVQLFLARMGKDARSSSLATEEIEHIGQICRRLDGIPLAIELAAAQALVRPLGEIVEHISQRLDSIQQPGRGTERQSSLRAALDWSYELLTQDERTLFSELSIFRGGLDLEAAESVCTLPDVLDLLFALRDKSLVRTEELTGELRYAMLETVRRYAAEQLAAEAQTGYTVRNRHAAYYLGLAESRNRAFIGGGPDASGAMHTLTTELDNLRSAMDWCLEAGHWERLVAFGKAMARFLITRGLYDECDRRLEAAATAATAIGDRSSLARLLNQRGLAAWQRASIELAEPLFRESYAISRSLGEQDRMLVSLINLGNLAWARSRFEEARQVWEEALVLAEQNKAELYEGTLHDDLGILLSQQGDHAGAERHFDRSIALHERSGNQELLAFSLYNLSDALRRRGNADEARSRAVESRRLFASLGHQRGLSLTAARLASLAFAEGDLFAAEVEAQVALRIAVETGDRHCEAYAQEVLARCVAARGDHDAARPRFLRSLALANEVGDRKHRADTLRHAAEARRTAGAVAQAYGLLLLARAEYAALGLEDAWLIATELEVAEQSLAASEAAAVQAQTAAASMDAAEEWL